MNDCYIIKSIKLSQLKKSMCFINTLFKVFSVLLWWVYWLSGLQSGCQCEVSFIRSILEFVFKCWRPLAASSMNSYCGLWYFSRYWGSIGVLDDFQSCQIYPTLWVEGKKTCKYMVAYSSSELCANWSLENLMMAMIWDRNASVRRWHMKWGLT